MIYRSIGKALVVADISRTASIGPRDLIEAVMDSRYRERRRWLEFGRTRFGADRCFALAVNLFGRRAALMLRTDPESGLRYSMSFAPGAFDPVNVAKREAYLDRLAAEEAEIARLAPSEDTLEGA